MSKAFVRLVTILAVSLTATVGAAEKKAAGPKAVEPKAADPKAAVEKKKVENKLPTVPKRKFKKKHLMNARYSHEKFDAIVDENAVLWIFPKDEGKHVGEPFTCFQLSCYYYIPGDPHHKGRPVIKFEDPPEPSPEPKKLTYRGLLKDNVPFVVQYEFDGNEITACGGCEDPEDIEYPTNFRILSSIRRSHNIPGHMELDEREKLLKGCTLITRELVGENQRKKKFDYEYSEQLKFHGPLEYVEVRGPYGQRKIIMKMRNPEGMLRGYVYSGYCPWQGFSIYYQTQGKEINLKKNKATMRIE